jgi:hypothetical protein
MSQQETPMRNQLSKLRQLLSMTVLMNFGTPYFVTSYSPSYKYYGTVNEWGVVQE